MKRRGEADVRDHLDEPNRLGFSYGRDSKPDYDWHLHHEGSAVTLLLHDLIVQRTGRAPCSRESQWTELDLIRAARLPRPTASVEAKRFGPPVLVNDSVLEEIERLAR